MSSPARSAIPAMMVCVVLLVLAANADTGAAIVFVIAALFNADFVVIACLTANDLEPRS